MGGFWSRCRGDGGGVGLVAWGRGLRVVDGSSVFLV